MIYLDHAATTPLPEAVADTMYDVLRHQFGNPSAQYPLGREAKELVEEASGGGWLLSLSAAGRPGQLQIRDENYRRLIRSVDPAAFGLDGEIEFTVNYRIPGKKEAKEKK